MKAGLLSDSSLKWQTKPRLVGYMRTTSEEWLKKGFVQKPDPAFGLKIIPFPEFYDVWIIRGSGTYVCGAIGCESHLAELHFAYIIGSDGEGRMMESWDGDFPPYQIWAFGPPAEEFNLV